MRRLSALVGLAILGHAPAARAADFFDKVETVAGVSGLILGVPDIVLFAIAVQDVTQGELPSKAVSITEAAIAPPQALLFNLAVAMEATRSSRRHRSATTALVAPAMFTSALATHGLWSTLGSGMDPAALFGVSTIVGGNTPLTVAVATNAVEGRWSHLSLAITQLVAGAQTVPVTAYQVATTESARAGWIALMAWSSTLTAHGVASLFAGHGRQFYAGGPAPVFRPSFAPVVTIRETLAPGMTLGASF